MTTRLSTDFREHRALAQQALQAKLGRTSASDLGRRAALLHDNLTTRELEELALAGLPEGH